MARQPEQRNAPCPAPTPATKSKVADRDGRADRVGSQLRGLYSDVLYEDIPDSFEDLLRKLG